MRAGLRLGAFVQLWLGAVVAGTQAAFPLLVPHSSWSREVAAYSIVGAVVAVLAVVAAVRGLWFAPLALAVAFQVGVGLTLGRDWTVWPWHLVGRGPASFHVGFVGFRFAAIGLASFVPALLLLVARPRRGEPRDLRSWWWVAALVPVAGLIAWQGLWYSSWLGRPLLVALALWLVLGRRDPRLAAAGAAVAGLSGASLLVDKYSSAWMSAHTWLGYLLAALAAALATRAVHARRLPA
jgi:uncharacterized membrane protein YhaH (DUF805 family)